MPFPRLNDSSLLLEDRIAELTFRRDDVGNALLGTSLADDIIKTVDWANQSKDVSVLILTGEGSSFSDNGNKPKDGGKITVLSPSLSVLGSAYRCFQRMALSIYNAEIPTIAAINGPALGTGFDLACLCDFRIGASTAQLGEPSIKQGVLPGLGGTWSLPRLIGHQKAVELAFSGRLIRADEALNIGLFLDVVGTQEQLLATAKLFARQLATKPPQALKSTKRLIRAAEYQELPEFIEFHATLKGMENQVTEQYVTDRCILGKRVSNYAD